MALSTSTYQRIYVRDALFTKSISITWLIDWSYNRERAYKYNQITWINSTSFLLKPLIQLYPFSSNEETNM